MDIPWGDERTKAFVTNVGLITTKGSSGHNIMAAEWTHMVSYEPGMIAVCVDPENYTHALLKKTKAFGVSLCADDQNVISSMSGHYSGEEHDKMGLLKELGFTFFKGKKVDVLLVQGAAQHFECKVVKSFTAGSHTIFIGEVVDAPKPTGKEPFAFHAGKYWKLREEIPKPSKEVRAGYDAIAEKHRLA